MRNFFDNLGYRLSDWMQGRNGMDTLARDVLILGVVLLVIELFVNNYIISLLVLACLVYTLFRCFSRNVSARANENARFESWTHKPRTAVKQTQKRWTNRKTTKYFKCSQCKQSLSVPKGKGTIRVTCPKCHNQTTIKS